MNTINVSVPLTDVNKYFSHMNHLLKAHFELVRLIEVENKLKKHHRAYLHVRERIDQLIRETSPRIAEIAADVTAVMDRSFMVEIPEEIMSDCDCDNCPCCECDCDCMACEEAPCNSKEDADEEYPFAEANEFDNSGTVMISKRDFDSMLDDVLTLAELVELVTEMRTRDMEFIQKHSHYFPAFAAYERNRLRMYKEANAEADAILERWDDAEFGEVRHITVEMR